MNDIRQLLKRPAVFHCTPRGGGIENRDIEVVHSSSRPLRSGDLPAWMPPSLQSVLSEFGALALFQPGNSSHDGFRLLNPAECDEALSLFLETIEDASNFLDEGELNRDEGVAQWNKNLRPIAELVESGDLFAIDMTNRDSEGECPVIFLDHEYYFGGFLDPDDVDRVANNVIELLAKILEDPLPFIASTWTGGDPNQQWFPESVSFGE